MAISRFAGIFNAAEFAYGINKTTPPLVCVGGPNATGSGTLTLAFGAFSLADGTTVNPFNLNAPILVGEGSSTETVTPTAVSASTPLVYGSTQITATFANLHGTGDSVRSGTCGLQEAINYASVVYGGGQIVVDAYWSAIGGTNAMIAAAVLPVNVSIFDVRTAGLQPITNAPSSLTALAAPTALSTGAATYGIITTSTTGGTISNATYRLGVTYVDIFGNETLLSVDTASTATIATTGTTSTISITSPAPLTGAIGYRVYMTAASGATLTEILYPVGNSAITGTAVANAVTPCFQIGTPVTINAVITGTAKVPGAGSAYTAYPIETNVVPLNSYPPFAALGTVAAAGTGTLAEINFPTGFWNQLGRTVRVKGTGYFTTNGTGGTVAVNHSFNQIYGVTSITPWTATTASIAASILTINFIFEVVYTTAATGASGTLEAHGFMIYNVAGTAVGSVAQDTIQAVSSTVSLAVQNTLAITHTNTTVGTSASQLRQLTIEVLK